MHIVSILTSLTSGGAEMLVVNLSKEYVAGGHRSTVLTLANADSVGNSAAMEETLRQRITADGGQVIALNLGAARNPVVGWWRLRRLLKTLQPDVVHAHTARALFMLFATKAPVVLTHHNSRLGFSPRMFTLFDTVVDSYVAISKETQALFARYVRRPIAYIPNAASRSFAAKAPRQTVSSARQILSVGAISAQKHYDLLIDIAADLQTRLPEHSMPKFLIAGGGTELEAMRALTDARGVEKHVSFLGERSDIADLMAASDLYLNTSRYEGMPVALLEAMASGLPIIATRVAGNTELVDHGKNGLLVPLDQPGESASAILTLLSDDNLYRDFSAHSINFSKTFSIENTASLHIDLFKRVIN